VQKMAPNALKSLSRLRDCPVEGGVAILRPCERNEARPTWVSLDLSTCRRPWACGSSAIPDRCRRRETSRFLRSSRRARGSSKPYLPPPPSFVVSGSVWNWLYGTALSFNRIRACARKTKRHGYVDVVSGTKQNISRGGEFARVWGENWALDSDRLADRSQRAFARIKKPGVTHCAANPLRPADDLGIAPCCSQDTVDSGVDPSGRSSRAIERRESTYGLNRSRGSGGEGRREASEG
jgi:hypothetical protein